MRILMLLLAASLFLVLRAAEDFGPAPAPAVKKGEDDRETKRWRAKHAPPPVVDPMDKAQDAKDLQKLAESGNASAQYGLGVFLEKGLGMEPDQEKAVTWYRKAAEQGLAKAQYRLGLRYAAGQGVTQDQAQAAAWFRLAAEQGFANAQFALGDCHLLGAGAKRDAEEAYFWLSLAVLGGCEAAAKERDAAAKLLPEERQAAVRARVLAWSPKGK